MRVCWLAVALAGKAAPAFLSREADKCGLPGFTCEGGKVVAVDLSAGAFGEPHKRLAEGLWNLSAVKVLDLSGNGLTSLPAEIGRLGTLEVLKLANNSLARLPAELMQLPKLATLDLAGNSLAALPGLVLELKAL